MLGLNKTQASDLGPLGPLVVICVSWLSFYTVLTVPSSLVVTCWVKVLAFLCVMFSYIVSLSYLVSGS